jgi:hypothetical protein
VRNGPDPSWRKCYTYPLEDRPKADGGKYSSGLRGLTSIEDPLAPGKHVILTAYEGVPGEVLRIIPETGVAVTELNTENFLRQKWHWQYQKNSGDKRWVLLAYNDMPKIETSSGPIRLMSLLAHSPNADEERSAWFLTRKEDTTGSDGYTLHEVKPIAGSRTESSDPALWSIRTFIVSPFKEDQGQVLYLGGYDGHWQPVHNTAWLYRAGINTLLRPYSRNVADPKEKTL